MDILIISDSHGKNDNIKKLLSRFRHLDLVIHLGDSQCYPGTMTGLMPCPLHIVRGNCDFIPGYPTNDVIPLQEHLAFITHGHNHYVKYRFDELRDAAKANGADIAMFGHTHEPCIDDSDSELLILNPGSIERPRQANGRPSYIFLGIDEDGTLHPNICYL